MPTCLSCSEDPLEERAKEAQRVGDDTHMIQIGGENKCTALLWRTGRGARGHSRVGRRTFALYTTSGPKKYTTCILFLTERIIMERVDV